MLPFPKSDPIPNPVGHSGELLEAGQPVVFHTLRQILQDVDRIGGRSDSGTGKQRNAGLNECCDAGVL
ncbi:MAG: hypothetical protein JNM43_08830 [Planctomycetaceae bacterium]|nr:hypothetical protein [Planctomycetaceae bacterium]